MLKVRFVVRPKGLVVILAASWLFTLSSCEFFRDHSTELGGGYILFNDDLSWIAPADLRNGASVYPEIKGYGFDDNFIVILQEPHRSEYLNTLAFDLRMRFTALTRVGDTTVSRGKGNSPLMSDSELYGLFKKNRISVNNTSQDITASTRIVDSLSVVNPFLKSVFANKTNYWIIDKRIEWLYGPFDKEMYWMERKKLGVDEDLQLRSVD